MPTLETKPKAVAIVLTSTAILALFYWPTFRWLVLSWLSSPYYSHGFLIPIVSAFFIWTKRKELKKGEPSAIGIGVLAMGAIIYIVGFIITARFLVALSLLCTISGIFLSFFGSKATRAIVFPLVFLIFMIPLPSIQEIGFHLQTVSLRASSWLLQIVGLPITTVGNEIHLGDAVFTVGLACSGINTLIALLALVAVYTYLLACPAYKKAMLFAIAFPIAIWANIARIASIVLVAHYTGAESATGLFHDLSSPLFFLLAFLCLILIGRILRCRLGVPVRRR